MNRKERRQGAKRAASTVFRGSRTSPSDGAALSGDRLAEAVRYHQAGKLAEAESLYRRILDVDPNHADCLHFYGVLAHQRGESDVAVGRIERAIALNDRNPAFHSNLGMALRAQGKFAEAVESYRRAIELKPSDPVTHFNLGNAFHAQRNHAAAVKSYTQALALRPDYADAHHNLGISLQTQGRHAEAEVHYLRALALNPNNAEAHYNLGIAMEAQGDPSKAAECYRRAINIRADYSEAYNSLGTLISREGKITEAVNVYRRAVAIKPDYASVYNNLGRVFSAQAKVAEAQSAYETAIALCPDDAGTRSNHLMSLHYLSNRSANQILETAKEFAAQFERPASVKCFNNSLVTDRPLRVGYVSGDFRNHPVGYFLDRVLPSHDRSKIEVYCYTNSPITDGMTERLRLAASQWRSVVDVSDENAASLIRADEIDILVDLSGHTALNRLTLFALRPAPVQISWLGYFGTTGLSAIDYVLTDNIVVKDEEQPYFTEKIWRLPGCYLCYAPHAVNVPVLPPPMASNPGVTFGCFNNREKISDATIGLWARLLSRTPGSILLLKTLSFADEMVAKDLREKFRAHGIDADRLILEGHSPLIDALFSYNRVDIALDPFPFGGCTTTAEALWMGTPVVTLQGERWVGRMSTSILTAIGHPEFVARSTDEYLQIAIGLATDRSRVTRLKASLRRDLEGSAFCDGDSFARNLEAAYRGMWRVWCERSHSGDPRA